MNLIRKTGTTLGGIFFGVLLFAALAPKATRAVAAALVQVTNTTSNPVNVSDVAPLEAFESSCFVLNDATPGFDGASCTISVPTGKRLVAHTVGMTVATDPGVRVIYASFVPVVGSNAINLTVVIPFTGNDGTNDISGTSQELHFYADGSLVCTLSFSQPTLGSTNCYAVGYLVDLP